MKNKYYLPVTQLELEEIFKLGMCRFPPRGPGNPVFWPNLLVDDAAWMARSHLTNFPPGYAGYVLAFSFRSEVADDIDSWAKPQENKARLVYLPASSFDNINRNVDFPICVVGAYFGPGHQGYVSQSGILADLLISQQLARLAGALSSCQLEQQGKIVRENQLAIFINFSFWLKLADLPALEVVRLAWQTTFPDLPLPTRDDGMVLLDERTRALAEKVRKTIQTDRIGQRVDQDTMAKLFNEIADLYQAQENLAKACIYWRKIAYGPSLHGIAALEYLRIAAGQLGQNRDFFKTKASSLSLLEAFLDEQKM